MADSMKYSDLFDFSSEEGIKKAITTIKSLIKVYNDFSKSAGKLKANYVSNTNDMIKSMEELTATSKKLNPTILKEQQEIVATSKQMDVLFASSNALTKKTTELDGAISKLTKEKASYNKSAKATQDINEQAIKLEAQLGKLSGQRAKEEAVLKQQIALKRKETAQLAKETLGLVSLYDKEVANLNKLQKEYRETALAQGINSKAAKELNATYLTQKARITGVNQQMGQFQSNVGNYKSAFAGLTSSLRQVGAALGFTGLIYGIIGAFKSGIGIIKSFDKSMVSLAAISNDTREGLKPLELEIRRVAATSINTANDVAQMAESLFTLGKTKDEVKDLLEPVNNLSIALQAPADAAGELLVKTLNAFGESSKEAQRYADVIAKMRTSTALDFEQIQNSLAYLAPTANAVGLSIENTGAILGVLVDNGIKAERAGRLMSSSFAKLATDGITLEQALNKVNESEDRVATASQLFGKQSFSLGLILADNIQKTNEYTKSFENAGGSLKKLTDDQLKSLDAQLSILNSSWQEFVLSIDQGEGVISKSISAIISGLTSLLSAMSAFDSDKVNIWEKLGSAISPLSYLLSAFRQESEKAEKQNIKTARSLELEDEAMSAYRIAIRDGITTVEDFMAVQDEFTISNATAAERLEFLKYVMDLYGKKVDETTIETSELTDIQKRQIDQYRELIDATRDYNSALDDKEIKAYIAAYKELQSQIIELEYSFREGLTEAAEEANKAIQGVSLDFGNGLDDFIQSGEGFIEILKEQEEALKESGDQAETWKEKLKKAAEDVGLAISTAFDAASIAVNQFFDNKSIRRENDFAAFEETQNSEIERLQARQERELENENLTTDAKEAINASYERKIGAIEDNIDRKKVELQRKQAKAAKAQALFNIVLNTAQGVSAALATLNPVLAIAIGVLGGVQFAAAASEPLPAYAVGTDSAKGGLSIVGEKGRELVKEPSGKTYLTGSKAELRDIPKGSQILTNAITERILNQREVDAEMSANNNSSVKLQKVAQQDRIGNYIEEIMISHARETDILIKGFNQAIKNLPEIHQWHMGSRDIRKDVKRGMHTEKNILDGNKWGNK